MASSFDIQAVLGIQRLVLSSPWTISLSVFLARWAILLLVAIVVYLFFARDKKKRIASIQAVLSLGTALAFVSVISRLVLRVRPFLAFQDVTLLIPPPLKTSFPSGHTAAAFALAFAIASGNRPLGILACILASAIAFSRMAVGVHYPTDILGGFAVGLPAFFLVRLLYRKVWIPRIAPKIPKTSHA